MTYSFEAIGDHATARGDFDLAARCYEYIAKQGHALHESSGVPGCPSPAPLLPDTGVDASINGNGIGLSPDLREAA